MKKVFLTLSLCITGLIAKATIFVNNTTSCTYVLSIPSVGYYSPIPPGTTGVPVLSLVQDLKVALWPSYPLGVPKDEI